MFSLLSNALEKSSILAPFVSEKQWKNSPRWRTVNASGSLGLRALTRSQLGVLSWLWVPYRVHIKFMWHYPKVAAIPGKGGSFEMIAEKDSPTIPTVQRKGSCSPGIAAQRAANEMDREETLQRCAAGSVVSSVITPGWWADGNIYSWTTRGHSGAGLQSRLTDQYVSSLQAKPWSTKWYWIWGFSIFVSELYPV